MTNTRGIFERPLAEYVLAVLLLFGQGPAHHAGAPGRAREWRHRETELLAGQRLLVLGAGGVGARSRC